MDKTRRAAGLEGGLIFFSYFDEKYIDDYNDWMILMILMISTKLRDKAGRVSGLAGGWYDDKYGAKKNHIHEYDKVW